MTSYRTVRLLWATIIPLVATQVACRKNAPGITAPEDSAVPVLRDAGVAHAKAEALLDCILRVIRESRTHALSAADVAKLCGGTVSPTEAPRSFAITTAFPGLSAHADNTDGQNLPAEELRLHVELSEGLALSTLAAALGAYRTVLESKTSSVLFTFRDSGTTGVYANLFTPKVTPGSPVLGLTIRRQ